MKDHIGTFYGVGVGPGDPELITLKALRVLETVPHIFAASSTKNSYSLALSIVQRHLGQARVTPLAFPMTKEAAILREAASADLVVLGATEGRFRRLVAATLPGDIARSCDRPLVIVRSAGRHRHPRPLADLPSRQIAGPGTP